MPGRCCFNVPLNIEVHIDKHYVPSISCNNDQHIQMFGFSQYIVRMALDKINMSINRHMPSQKPYIRSLHIYFTFFLNQQFYLTIECFIKIYFGSIWLFLDSFSIDFRWECCSKYMKRFKRLNTIQNEYFVDLPLIKTIEFTAVKVIFLFFFHLYHIKNFIQCRHEYWLNEVFQRGN